MTIGVRGIAQVVVFVEDPSASARFWPNCSARRRLANGGALIEPPFAKCSSTRRTAS